MHPRRLAGAGLAGPVALLAALVLGACGSSDSEGQVAVSGGPDLGVRIGLADCTDWNNADVEQRLGTIRELKEFIGADVPGTTGRGPVLDDDDAYDLLDGYCQQEFARAFKLYKLYSRAAAFGGH
jgi:hypothetical protein